MKELKIKHTFRFVPFIFLMLMLMLFLAPRLAIGWWSNQASFLLLQFGVDVSPEQSPILAMGIRPPNYEMEKNLLFIESSALKTDVFNVHRGQVGAGLAPAPALETSRYGKVISLLEQPLSYSPNNKGVLMKLARLELLSGHYKRALDYLVELERDSVCAHLNGEELNCYPLWMAIGDALDGMGQAEQALEYYRATNWVGRQEAASFLALQLAEQALKEEESDAQKWLDLALDSLPGALATLYASHPQQTALRQLDNPNMLLALRTDPRLERLNAEATVGLLRAGVWDEEVFHRVLAARAWAVDTHTFDYGEYKKIWLWTADLPNITARTDGLMAYFERIVELVPEDGDAWFYFAEAKARLGECEANDALPLALPISTPSQSTLSVEMERWRSYGQAVRFTAAPSHQYGYEQHATWLWGADKLYHTQGQAAFRADCLWHETSSEPTFLALTLTNERGEIDYLSVPANHELEVSYWWKTMPEAQLAAQWRERSDSGGLPVDLHRSDTVSQETDWVYTTLTLPSTNRERVFEFRWHVMGCGGLWLDHLTFSIMEG
jgi:tetratricopeptide (TPR) repeat protein